VFLVEVGNSPMNHRLQELLGEPFANFSEGGPCIDIVESLFDMDDDFWVWNDVIGVERVLLISESDLTVRDLSVPVRPPV
jgi:hypothetical protein